MNKQKPGGIGRCDYTFNPVTGCWGPGGTVDKPNRCAYCYAQKLTRRSTKDERMGNADSFMPKFHEDRLSQPAKVKKPSKIFVCSMADLFGDWIATEWIETIFRTVRACPHHTFQFLTKNPRRLKDFNPWPDNCWVGTTVTNQADADERLPWLLQVEASVLFVSHEPLLSKINMTKIRTPAEYTRGLNAFTGYFDNTPFDEGLLGNWVGWGIIGSMTGPGAVKPKYEWVQSLHEQYRAAGVPIFLKDNLKWTDGHYAQKIQEFPK
jgi:protein gp37